MGTILVWTVGVLMIALGIIGCFVHRVPGPILTYLGILEIQFVGDVPLLSTEAIVICGVVVVLAKVLERYIPKITEKIHEVSKSGKWGSIIGSLLGLLLMVSVGKETGGDAMTVVWLILALGVVPFAVTFLFEVVKKRPMQETLLATTAAYLTFLLGTILKLGVCIYCIYAIVEVRSI